LSGDQVETFAVVVDRKGIPDRQQLRFVGVQSKKTIQAVFYFLFSIRLFSRSLDDLLQGND
jgi:hypothetical protein